MKQLYLQSVSHDIAKILQVGIWDGLCDWCDWCVVGVCGWCVVGVCDLCV